MYMFVLNKEIIIIVLINYYFRINESFELIFKGLKRISIFLFWEWELMLISICDGI